MAELRKVLLVNPRTTVDKGNVKRCMEPLGNAYLASVLEDSGFDVSILDVGAIGYEIEENHNDGMITFGLPPSELEARIREMKPDLVGISNLFTSQFHNAEEVVNIVDSIDSDIPIVMGGAHVSALPRRTLEEIPVLDYIVTGEGEFAFRDLLVALNKRTSLDAVDGLVYRLGKEVRVNPKLGSIESLSALPFPARRLLDMEKYFEIGKPQNPYTVGHRPASVLTSRGCPAKCTFCASTRMDSPSGINQMVERERLGPREFSKIVNDPNDGKFRTKYRERTPQNVLDELRLLRDTYGVDEFQFVDDNLTSNWRQASVLFDTLIEEKMDIPWCTPNGVAAWTLAPDKVRKMAEAGCYQVTFAVESGNRDILKQIKKPVNLEHIPELVTAAKESGMRCHAYFIMGFPQETLGQMRETMEYALMLKGHGLDSASFSVATPLPGTPLYEQCLQGGCLIDGFSWRHVRLGTPVIRSPHWEIGEMLAVQQEAYLRINSLDHEKYQKALADGKISTLDSIRRHS